jgi:hypothetical protein
VKVFKIQPPATHPYLMPGADPGEGFCNTNYQLFSTDEPCPAPFPPTRTPPDLSSSAQINDHIQTRTAAWTQHLERRRQRREAAKAAKKRK